MSSQTDVAGTATVGSSSPTQPLLEMQHLTVTFRVPQGRLVAVRDVSLKLQRGEVLGLVGESGCGKSTTGLTTLRLLPIPPARIDSGKILFNGTDLLKLSPEAMRELRGSRLSMIFQNPISSLNPTYTVGSQVVEGLQAHQRVSPEDARKRVVELFEQVGLPAPAERLDAYPHELSGGMRQRVMIAMAIAMNPDLLVADEPTTALDVTIQAQILSLLDRLRRELGMAVIYITHDLVLAGSFCQRIAVMYAGQIVEQATAAELFEEPLHPYTQGLLRALPYQHWKEQRLESIPGEPPSLLAGTHGCAFAPRCPYAGDRCRSEDARALEIKAGHWVRCFGVEEGRTERMRRGRA